MHIPRVLILPLLISMCVAAQRLPGNVQLPFLCIASEPQPEITMCIKNHFTRPFQSEPRPPTV